MKTPALVLLLLFAFFMSACDNSEPVGRPQAGNDSGMNVEANDASLLITDLNEHLEKAGAPQCAPKNPDLNTGVASTIPNQGAAVCRFSNESPLVVLIVRNGEATYKRYFAGQRGPNYFLRGPNWIIVANIGVPPKALDVIREDLGASG